MGEEGAAGRWSGDDFSRVENGAWKNVDQILGKAPDRRRLSEKLMRVQVDTAVIAVAEIEVPVEHQHLVALQILESFLANVVSFVHASPAVVTVSSRRRDSYTPYGLHDGRGDSSAQFPAIERRVLRPRSHLRRADSDFEIGREDGDIRRATRRQRSSRDAKDPRRTSGHQLDQSREPDQAGMHQPIEASGTAVSSPTIPNGARSNSTLFSS